MQGGREAFPPLPSKHTVTRELPSHNRCWCFLYASWVPTALPAWSCCIPITPPGEDSTPVSQARKLKFRVAKLVTLMFGCQNNWGTHKNAYSQAPPLTNRTRTQFLRLHPSLPSGKTGPRSRVRQYRRLEPGCTSRSGADLLSRPSDSAFLPSMPEVPPASPSSHSLQSQNWDAGLLVESPLLAMKLPQS